MSAPADRVEIPADALVLLIGAAGSGKSTFAARHFAPDAVISSDGLRALVGESESDQRANPEVFERMQRFLQDRMANDKVFAWLQSFVLNRLVAGAVTIVDATNTDWMRRAELIGMARRHRRPVIGVVFDLPLEICLSRIAARSRTLRTAVVRQQVADLRRDRERLDLEGFAAIYVLGSSHQVERTSIDIKKGPVARALSS